MDIVILVNICAAASKQEMITNKQGKNCLQAVQQHQQITFNGVAILMFILILIS